MHDARLFADRSDMLLALCQKGGTIGEVGVGLGHFSSFVLPYLQPDRFLAIDLFDLHTKPNIWGRTAQQVFGDRTHRAFFDDMFAAHASRMTVLEGQSAEALGKCADLSIDVLYVDADHSYAGVQRDIVAALPKMKPDGLLVFNDYVLQAHIGNEPFGVVRAVNELVLASDWRVVGFSLQRHMYCDIALRRLAP